MISKSIISVVIPALNEEMGIAKTINEIPKKKLEEMGYKCEAVVVDGGSNDRTREVARDCGARVIVEMRPGYGIAYKTGFSRASGDIIVALDADFSYPAFLIPNLVKLLEEQNFDFISTNRLNASSRASFHHSHLVGNKVLSFFTRLLFRVDISDSQSGMWVFKRRILDRASLSSNGMPFSEELKIFAFRFFRSTEISIPYRKRIGKQKLHALLDGGKNLAYLFFLSLSFRGFDKLLRLSRVTNSGGVDFAAGSCCRIVLSPSWWARNTLL